MGRSYLLDFRSRYRNRKGAPGGKTGLIKSGDMPATKLEVAPPVWEGSHGLNCRGKGEEGHAESLRSSGGAGKSSPHGSKV